MKDLLLAIDQGTTGSTVLVLDKKFTVVARASNEIPPEYPQPAWVEHDLSKLWSITANTIKDALDSAQIAADRIAAIGITNQRETVGVWDKTSLRPLAKAIVWQCRRTTDFCSDLKAKGLEERVRQSSGLVLDPYFSGSKMRWFLDNVEELKTNSNFVFGNIDTFLIQNLTAGSAFVTDVSNASRTSLMNLETLDWDDELLQIFGINKTNLPKICSSSEIYGETKGLEVLPDGIPIAGILGDQQAALLGQLCLEPGDAKITYGTGCFLLANTGDKISYSKNGLLTTVAWKINDKVSYALEGSAFMGGATVQWLRDGLGIINKSSEVEALAMDAEDADMGDLMLVPAMTGLGAPHWDASARGMLSGITRGTNRSHIARACLEGIAHQNDELLSAMAEDMQSNLKTIKVDGGAAANNFLLQYQCDLAQVPLSRPKLLETTALGAAIAAGLAIKFWNSLEDVKSSWQLDNTFNPELSAEKVSSAKKRWSKAIERCRV